ncbi:hypothetical protein ACFLT9_10955 [Acidobacteriota bacterium]
MFKKKNIANSLKHMIGTFLILSFISFLFNLPVDASFQPGRTLVIHNNTSATLYVLNWSSWIHSSSQEEKKSKTELDLYNAANMVIPPNSKKSLFNFLLVGNNTLFIYAKKVRPKLRRTTSVIKVSGNERRPNELNVFPQDFDKTTMFDAPGDCSDLSGSWKQSTDVIGSSVWVLTRTGTNRYDAKEVGLGVAKGTASLIGQNLLINWKSAEMSGYYKWELGARCDSGEGKLKFTEGWDNKSFDSTVRRQ